MSPIKKPSSLSLPLTRNTLHPRWRSLTRAHFTIYRFFSPTPIYQVYILRRPIYIYIYVDSLFCCYSALASYIALEHYGFYLIFDIVFPKLYLYLYLSSFVSSRVFFRILLFLYCVLLLLLLFEIRFFFSTSARQMCAAKEFIYIKILSWKLILGHIYPVFIAK